VEEVESGEDARLSKIIVKVDRLKDESGRLPTEDEMGGYQLVHWMRNGKQPDINFDERGP
jgi:hypothetical protein